MCLVVEGSISINERTSVILTLASSTTDTGTDNNVSLLGFVSETMGLVSARRTIARQHVGALTVFPGANTHQETKGIRLLVTP